MLIVCFSSVFLYKKPSLNNEVDNVNPPSQKIASNQGETPVILRAVKTNTDDFNRLEFIFDTGDFASNSEMFKQEAMKSIKYFFAGITLSNDNFWVNLSPYEKDRISTEHLASTDLGDHLLEQDYMLKNKTASFMAPDSETGSVFWGELSQSGYIGLSEKKDFSKVWIVPESIELLSSESFLFVKEAKLNVLVDKDHMADEINKQRNFDGILKEKFKKLILPEIKREVNHGKDFVTLRQIYNSLVLAQAYKEKFPKTIFNGLYADKNITMGIENKGMQLRNEIYGLYVDSFNNGVVNCVIKSYSQQTQRIEKQHYFSGGITCVDFKPYIREVTIDDETIRSDLMASAVGENKKVETICNVNNSLENVPQLISRPDEFEQLIQQSGIKHRFYMDVRGKRELLELFLPDNFDIDSQVKGVNFITDIDKTIVANGDSALEERFVQLLEIALSDDNADLTFELISGSPFYSDTNSRYALNHNEDPYVSLEGKSVYDRVARPLLASKKLRGISSLDKVKIKTISGGEGAIYNSKDHDYVYYSNKQLSFSYDAYINMAKLIATSFLELLSEETDRDFSEIIDTIDKTDDLYGENGVFSLFSQVGEFGVEFWPFENELNFYCENFDLFNTEKIVEKIETRANLYSISPESLFSYGGSFLKFSMTDKADLVDWVSDKVNVVTGDSFTDTMLWSDANIAKRLSYYMGDAQDVDSRTNVIAVRDKNGRDALYHEGAYQLWESIIGAAVAEKSWADVKLVSGKYTVNDLREITSASAVENIIGLDSLSALDASIVGGKAASYAELGQIEGIDVAKGFCVTTSAYAQHLNASRIDQELEELQNLSNDWRIAADLEQKINIEDQIKELTELIRTKIMATEIDQSIAEELALSIEKIDLNYRDHLLAVRSSATTEDMDDASFAGQYDTFLNKKGEDEVLDSIKKVWASTYNFNAVNYRNKHGLEHSQAKMGVLILEMVDAYSAGTAFSIDVETGASAYTINNSYGLGEAEVAGITTPDSWFIDLDTNRVVKRRKGSKENKIVYDHQKGSNVVVENSLEDKLRYSIPAVKALEIANKLKKIHDHYTKKYGSINSIDAEYAVDKQGKTIFTQARPETVWGTGSHELMMVDLKKVTNKIVIEGGVTGCPGVVSGTLRFVDSAEMANAKVQKGDIMLAPNTTSVWERAMGISGGMITEIGGNGNHTAVIAREQNTPALVGMDGAIERLKSYEGQIVTIDATSKRIFLGKVDEKAITISKDQRTEYGGLDSISEEEHWNGASGAGQTLIDSDGLRWIGKPNEVTSKFLSEVHKKSHDWVSENLGLTKVSDRIDQGVYMVNFSDIHRWREELRKMSLDELLSIYDLWEQTIDAYMKASHDLVYDSISIEKWIDSYVALNGIMNLAFPLNEVVNGILESTYAEMQINEPYLTQFRKNMENVYGKTLAHEKNLQYMQLVQSIEEVVDNQPELKVLLGSNRSLLLERLKEDYYEIYFNILAYIQNYRINSVFALPMDAELLFDDFFNELVGDLGESLIIPADKMLVEDIMPGNVDFDKIFTLAAKSAKLKQDSHHIKFRGQWKFMEHMQPIAEKSIEFGDIASLEELYELNIDDFMKIINNAMEESGLLQLNRQNNFKLDDYRMEDRRDSIAESKRLGEFSDQDFKIVDDLLELSNDLFQFSIMNKQDQLKYIEERKAFYNKNFVRAKIYDSLKSNYSGKKNLTDILDMIYELVGAYSERHEWQERVKELKIIAFENLSMLHGIYKDENIVFEKIHQEAVKTNKSVVEILTGAINLKSNNHVDELILKKRNAITNLNEHNSKFVYLGGGGFNSCTIGRALRYVLEHERKVDLKDAIASVNVATTLDRGGSSQKDADAVRTKMQKHVMSPGDLVSVLSWHTVEDSYWFSDESEEARLSSNFKPENHGAIIDTLYRYQNRITVSEEESLESILMRRVEEVNADETLHKPDNWLSFVVNVIHAAKIVDDQLISKGYIDGIRDEKTSVQNLLLMALFLAYDMDGQRAVNEFNNIIGLTKTFGVASTFEDAVQGMLLEKDGMVVDEILGHLNIANESELYTGKAYKLLFKKEFEGDRKLEIPVNMSPEELPGANIDALSAIRNVEDGIVLGLGSAFDSTLANFLVKDVINELQKAKKRGIPLMYFPKVINEVQTNGLSLKEILLVMERSIQTALGDETLRLEDFMSHVVIPDVPYNVYNKYLEQLKEKKKSYLTAEAISKLDIATTASEMEEIMSDRSNWNLMTKKKVSDGEIKIAKLIPGTLFEFDSEDEDFLRSRGVEVIKPTQNENYNMFMIWEEKIAYNPNEAARQAIKIAEITQNGKISSTISALTIDKSTVNDIADLATDVFNVYLKEIRDAILSNQEEQISELTRFDNLLEAALHSNPHASRDTYIKNNDIPRIELRGQDEQGGYAQIAIIGLVGTYAEEFVATLNDKFHQFGLSAKFGGTMTIEVNREGVDKALALDFLEANFEAILNLIDYEQGSHIDVRKTKTVLAADFDGTLCPAPNSVYSPGLDESILNKELIDYVDMGGLLFIITGNDLNSTVDRIRSSKYLNTHNLRQIIVAANSGSQMIYFDDKGEQHTVLEYNRNALKYLGHESRNTKLDLVYLGDNASADGNDFPAFERVGFQNSISVATKNIDKRLQQNNVGNGLEGTKIILEFIVEKALKNPRSKLFAADDIADIVTKAYNPFAELSIDKLQGITKGVYENINDIDNTQLPMARTFLYQDTEIKAGNYLAIDWGGTNLRIIEIEIDEAGDFEVSSMKEFRFNEKHKTGEEDPFEFIVDKIKTFKIDPEKDYKIGFTFSQPVVQLNLRDSYVEEWVKGWSLEKYTNRNIPDVFEEKLQSAELKNVDLGLVVGDMAAVHVFDKQTDIAMIVGTGYDFSVIDDNGEIINTEVAAYELDKSLLNQYDKLMYDNVLPYKSRALEKMTSGAYLPKLFGLCMKDLRNTGKFLSHDNSVTIFDNYDYTNDDQTDSIYVKLISLLEREGSIEDLRDDVSAIEGLKGITFNNIDLNYMRSAANSISKRAGRLIGATLFAAISQIDEKQDEIVIGVDGSLYEKHPKLRFYIDHTIEELYRAAGNIEHPNIVFNMQKDASGLGAAIAAARVSSSSIDYGGINLQEISSKSYKDDASNSYTFVRRNKMDKITSLEPIIKSVENF